MHRPRTSFPALSLWLVATLVVLHGCCSDDDPESGTPQLAEGADLTGLWRVTTTIDSASAQCTGIQVGQQEIEEVPIDFDLATRLVTLDPGTAIERVALLTGLTIRFIENSETERRDTTITFNNAGSVLEGTTTLTIAATGCAIERRITGTKIGVLPAGIASWVEEVVLDPVPSAEGVGLPPSVGTDWTHALSVDALASGAGVVAVRIAAPFAFDAVTVGVEGHADSRRLELPDPARVARLTLRMPRSRAVLAGHATVPFRIHVDVGAEPSAAVVHELPIVAPVDDGTLELAWRGAEGLELLVDSAAPSSAPASAEHDPEGRYVPELPCGPALPTGSSLQPLPSAVAAGASLGVAAIGPCHGAATEFVAVVRRGTQVPVLTRGLIDRAPVSVGTAVRRP